MTAQQNPQGIRNLIVFYVGTMLLAIGGGFVMASGQEIGGLLFILSPLVMVLIVRFLLGDGWKDAGLGLKFKKSWRWYLFALLVYPVIYLVVIPINIILGFTTLTLTVSDILPLLISGFVIQFVPRILFAFSEEWAWRGYLEPRFALLGMPDIQRHVIVGILWGIWHFPLILSTDYTNAPIAAFLPLFMLGVILMALIYGPMRASSDSVWPAVLMHGMGNALAFAILEGKLIAFNNDLLGNIGTGSIAISIVYGLIAFVILRRRRLNRSPEISHASPA